MNRRSFCSVIAAMLSPLSLLLGREKQPGFKIDTERVAVVLDQPMVVRNQSLPNRYVDIYLKSGGCLTISAIGGPVHANMIAECALFRKTIPVSRDGSWIELSEPVVRAEIKTVFQGCDMLPIRTTRTVVRHDD